MIGDSDYDGAVGCTFEDDQLVQQAAQAGAVGYLLKDTPSEEVAQAIRAVHRGYAQFGPGIFSLRGR